MPRFEHVRPGTPGGQRRNPFTGEMQFFPGLAEKRKVWEIELRGNVVETCTFEEGRKPRIATERHRSPADAERAYHAEISQMGRRGYKETGPSRVLTPARPSAGGSSLMLDELFAAGDPRFVDEVLACDSDKKLATLADRWFSDPRPEMRRGLLAYVDDGCDRFGHKPLVKRLFKKAEAASDDELLGRFMVAFDRFVRRSIVRRRTWHSDGGYGVRVVFAADATLPLKLAKGTAAPRFTRRTRAYLARRAFRYFRRLGRQDALRFGRVVREALVRYTDEHLDAPERILDAWSLVHVLYGWSPVLVRRAHGVVVAEGRTIGELQPAPYFPAAFQGVFEELLDMLAAARARVVRAFTVTWLEKEYKNDLDGLPAARLRPLLASPYDEVSTFAAARLERAKGLETLPIADWLELFAIKNLDIVPLVVAAFEKYVAPKRVSLAQCADLAMAGVASIADLGLRWAKEKPLKSAEDLGLVARIAQAPVERVRREATRWLLELFESSPLRRAEHLRDLFDSKWPDVRAEASAYIEKQKDQQANLPLWFALLESPYDDVRALLVRHAEAWQKSAGPEELEHLAASVLLAVHRGSTTKAALLRKLADRTVAAVAEADRLFPVLALALRSVRGPERIGALSAVTRAVMSATRERASDGRVLRAAVERHIPELSIGTQVSQ
jgi:hypothetical protein